jgi:hypothetical protein
MSKEGLARTVLLVTLFCLLFVAIAASPALAIFTGTCEGYVYWMNGTKVTNAGVTVNVSGCSGSGCVMTTNTDNGGYYVLANLNLNAYGAISGVATKNGNSGNASTNADAYQAASLNITICIPPSTPILLSEPDTHDASAVLQWVSGNDALGLSTYDQYTLFSTSTQTSPYNQTGIAAVSNTTRTWSVRTCNSACCGANASDSFISINDPPPAPLLTTAISNHDQNRTFFWINYSDSDGDSTYNEYQLDAGTIISPANSPQSASGLSFANHTWRVRTCDSRGACSVWSSNAFNVSNGAPAPPVLVPQNDTNQTSLSFQWTSGVDADGDDTHDEYRLANDTGYVTIVNSSTNAISPHSITGLLYWQKYSWSVRTCDEFGACSDWVEDSFVTYLSSAGQICSDDDDGGSSSGGGGGGGGGGVCPCQNECEAGHAYCRGNTRAVCGYFDSDYCADLSTQPCPSGTRCEAGSCVTACEPDWQCGGYTICDFGSMADWQEENEVQLCHIGNTIKVSTSAAADHIAHGDHYGPCGTGIQRRSCTDKNVCGTSNGRPEEVRTCALAVEDAPMQLLGVSVPGAISIPVRTLVIDVGMPALLVTIAVGILVGLGLIFFTDELNMLLLMWRLRKVERLCRKKRFGTAYGHMLGKVDPLLRHLKPRIKETLRSHRRLLYRYHFANASIFRALQGIYSTTGEPMISVEFGKKMAQSEEMATMYKDAMRKIRHERSLIKPLTKR